MRRILVLLLLAACSAPAARDAAPDEAATPAPARAGESATLVRVTDGDTIVVAVGGRTERVRLIGIDTPERDQCFFREASRHVASLLRGGALRLERDVSERDRYGRLLRYVWAGEDFVNERMVADGYAAALTYPPDVANAERFVALQRGARASRRGLWNACR